MLLCIKRGSDEATRVRSKRLRDFGMDERGLQDILYKSLDRLIGDDELMILSQSTRWREEPDLMALDRDGTLYLFEIKVWESASENLLQVLRYGQLFGGRDYEGLQKIWQKSSEQKEDLATAHAKRFDCTLDPKAFNRKQVFVVLTNGLDSRTRIAIRYWRNTGLDVRAWIYRAHDLGSDGELYLEILPFRSADDPLEDYAESAEPTYYIVNTNYTNDPRDDADMLGNRKAAAYFTPWKQKIARLKRGDFVFLYRSGEGIVATGKADGKLRKSPYHADPEENDEEFSMGLTDFAALAQPCPAATIKEITKNQSMTFRQTMFALDPNSGEILWTQLRG